MNYISKGVKDRALFTKHCPMTTQLLEQSVGDLLMEGTPFSYTFFSTMKPGSSTSPHYGPSNMKLRCHLPLFVPEEAFIRVAGDPRPWEKGKMLIYDDTYENEAANLSDKEDRVILSIDIWHPDLQREERKEI